METWLIPLVLNGLMGLLMWFFKSQLSDIKEQIKGNRDAIHNIELNYTPRIEIKELRDTLRQDLKEFKDEIKDAIRKQQ